MENQNENIGFFDKDEDIITIHLGKVLPEEQYNLIVESVIEFLNKNWSHILTIQS